MEKYFSQIEIEDADFVSWDNAKSDAAYLLLNVPVTMLKEYMRMKGQNKKLPNGAEFWKETGLVRRLKDSDKYHGQGHVMFLPDVLDYLEGEVDGNYQELNDPERIRLSITEIPEFLPLKDSFD